MLTNLAVADDSPEPAPRMLEQAQRLIQALNDDRITARLLGGLAVAVRCPTAQAPSPLARSYSDFDIIVDRSSRRSLPEALERLGFSGVDRFNAINGHARQLYTSREGLELDVFIERFSMCHELDLKGRLALDERTLTLADLVLTKLQVAELTEKDIVDFASIALDHELTRDDVGISVTRITNLVGSDWGWWKTVTDNLEKVLAHLDEFGLPEDAAARVRGTTCALLDHINTAPKSLRWRTRAAIGERMAWREDPDEKR